jgi:hypothetical protein
VDHDPLLHRFLTNLIVALVFHWTGIGQVHFGEPSLLGGTTMAIVLVGVVNHLLLRDCSN